MDAAAASEVGRALAGMRRRRDKVCPVCQESFVAFGRQVYCAPKCSKRRWWLANRGGPAPGAARPQQLPLGIGEDTAVT
jgi:hypothetical protein